MENQALMLKQLFYAHMGSQPYYLRNFYDSVVYLDEPFSEITLQVIRLLLGDRSACDSCRCANSRIEATVLLGNEAYTVRVAFPAGAAEFHVTDCREQDCTSWYLQTVSQSPEERFWTPGVYPVRLPQCKDGTGSPHCLRQYIRDFQPQRLLPNKEYWLQPEADGSFTLRLGKNGEELPCLSETESRIYHYLCYLHSLHFWDSMQQLHCDQAIRLPILLYDLTDRVDEEVDIQPLLAQAESLGRQVLIFL